MNRIARGIVHVRRMARLHTVIFGETEAGAGGGNEKKKKRGLQKGGSDTCETAGLFLFYRATRTWLVNAMNKTSGRNCLVSRKAPLQARYFSLRMSQQRVK